MPSLLGLTLVQAAREPGRYRARFHLEPQALLLDGHFPGHPVLPAIAQVGLAVRGAHELLGSQAALASLSGVRFRQAVRPGDTIDLVVTRPGGRGPLRFELTSAQSLVSSGRLGFGGDTRG
jgi:3-hydroxymyristoyl/3-hydroxydecanoyl-(acyl carrier protein) dehydratase